VPDPRAVQVHGEPGGVRGVDQGVMRRGRGDRAARGVVGVLQAEQRGAQRVVRAGGPGGGAHVLDGGHARAGGPRQLDGHPLGDPGGGAELEVDHVGVRGGEEAVAAAQVQHQADQVGHGAGRHPQCVLQAGDPGDGALQLAQGGVAVEHVVADRGLGHRAAHRRGGAGDGVGPQIDHRVLRDAGRGW
jgi:hypothetical protein